VRFYRADQVVGQLFVDEHGTMRTVAAAPLAPPLQPAIHAFKYTGTPQLAPQFGAMMHTAWHSAGLPVDAFVPVPLHPRRIRERGFNQSQLLAAEVATHTRRPVLSGALARTRYTSQQAHLTKPQRRANVRGAFIAEAAQVFGKHLVIVDDVFTTGATIGECALVLLNAGAQSVAALTLARA
jgi:ComF family protein